MVKAKHYKLKRSLSLFEATLYGVGIILGAGIYVLLGAGAGIAGNAIWISFIIAAIIAGLFEIKDYFWYGRGFSLQMISGAAERIKKYFMCF